MNLASTISSKRNVSYYSNYASKYYARTHDKITPQWKSTLKEGRISKRFQRSSDFYVTTNGGQSLQHSMMALLFFYIYIYGYFFRETQSNTFMGRHISFPPRTLIVKPKSFQRHLLLCMDNFFCKILSDTLLGKNIPRIFDLKAVRETKNLQIPQKKKKKNQFGHRKVM